MLSNAPKVSETARPQVVFRPACTSWGGWQGTLQSDVADTMPAASCELGCGAVTEQSFALHDADADLAFVAITIEADGLERNDRDTGLRRT
jgi:hypothetical protein